MDIDDLDAGDALLGLGPLDEAALDLVVGGMRADTGYVCTATTADGGTSEDCWKE